jgi:hypothetical protein
MVFGQVVKAFDVKLLPLPLWVRIPPDTLNSYPARFNNFGGLNQTPTITTTTTTTTTTPPTTTTKLLYTVCSNLYVM